MVGRLIKSLLDFILPPRRTEVLVERLGLEDLQSIQTPGGLPYHAPEVEALVWEIKYYGNHHAARLAGALLAEELMGIAAEELGRPLLIPIPMHYSRLSERGHNQTELLCQAALKELTAETFDYAPRALSRTKHTPEQQKLDRMRRLKNVHDSMSTPYPEQVKGRVCVVVDDVTTTGATFVEATRALKAAGALRVHCVALAQS